MSDSAAFAVRDVYKRFGGTLALQGCSLEVKGGEVHGLVGANGAGKSTLVKIVSGAIEPDSGVITVSDWEGRALNPRLAQELAIATIYQEPDLVPPFDISQNVALGREPRRYRIFCDRHAERMDALAEMERVGLGRQTLNRPIESLSRAEQQLVEIVKALHRQVRLILMDEPTAPLGPREVEQLHTVIRDLAARGVAVLYISHRLREVLDICDRVTVIRDGTNVLTQSTESLDDAVLVRAMIGHELKQSVRVANAGGEVVFEAKGLSQGGRVKDVALQLHAGEIVGVAGLIGAGRSRLLRAMIGAEQLDAGEMLLRGRPYRPSSPADALRKGIALVPEDRKTQGLFMEMTVAENLLFSRPLQTAGALRRRAETACAREWIGRLRIVTPRPSTPVRNLSGGNQQKVLLARALQAKADVLLIDEPGQGVDVHGKDEIFKIVREAASEGKAVLASCSESDDLFSLADRILVMRHGAVVRELGRREASEEAVLAIASGLVEAAP